MSVGTSDGHHYEEEIDHILDRPLQFDEPTLKEPGGEEDMVSPRALTSTPKPSMPAVKRGIEQQQLDLQDIQQTGPVDRQVIPGEGVPNTQGRDIRRSDLDRRTPPPLPVVPSHSIAPHNPNPPGGGPYNIKPGEKLSANWAGEGSDMEGRHKPLDEDQVFIEDLKDLPPDWKEILSDPDQRAKGYRVRVPKPALMSDADERLQAGQQYAMEDTRRIVPEGPGRASGGGGGRPPAERTPGAPGSQERIDYLRRQYPQTIEQQGMDTLRRELPQMPKNTPNIKAKDLPEGNAALHSNRAESMNEVERLAAKLRTQTTPAKEAPKYQTELKSSDKDWIWKGDHYDIVQEGKPVGNLHINDRGKDIHVEWISSNKNNPQVIQRQLEGRDRGEAFSSNTLGKKAMRDLIRQLKDMYPDAETISGLRISGARDVSGGGPANAVMRLR